GDSPEWIKAVAAGRSGPWRRRLTAKLGRFATNSKGRSRGAPRALRGISRDPRGVRSGPRFDFLPVPAVCAATALHASAHRRADLSERMSDKPLTDITFSSFELPPVLWAGLESAGFTRCTPIQALTLPVALTGGDVAGQAQTGTGKTLAFLVTVVNRLLPRPALADRKPEDPRALILAPTRELAIQIHKDAVKFASDLGLKFALVYGGVDYDKQRAQLQEGADVIIATPGRLIG